jgi:biotin carboxylase
LQKKLLLLGAGFEQKIVIDHAHNLGIHVIAVDGDPNAQGLKIADTSIVGNIKNVDELCAIAKKYSVNGVMTHAVEIPHIVSRVSERMNLPGLPSEIADRATNKLSRIKCFKDKKIPSPAFEFASSKDEAYQKAKTMKFPIVIKPIDNAGSRGVSKIEKIENIHRGYDDAILFSKEKTVLLEEFLVGPEISTESIIFNGKIITTGFADRNYSTKERFKPYMIENGHTIPSILPSDTQRKIIQVAEDAIRAIGINFGVAKGDLILDNNEPKVLEMAARTSGGRFASDMVPLSSGVDIIPALIQMSLGLDVNVEFLRIKYKKAAAQRFFFPPPGKIINIKNIDRAKSIPGVYEIFLRTDVKIGGIIKPITNHSDRVGYVITSGNTRDQAVNISEEVVNMVDIEVR